MELIDRYATRHHGLITFAASGLSRDAWGRATRNGRLDLLHAGVARLPGSARSTQQAVLAAVLAAGSGALASHRSAAFLWGMPRPQVDDIDVLVGARGHRPRLANVTVHRPTDTAHLVPARRHGIPCTNALRTLCDLGAVDRSGVKSAVGHALTMDLVTIGALEMALIEHGRRGRAGIGPLRRAVEAWLIGGKPADSVLELAMVRLIRRFALPPVEFHPMIEGFEVDFRIVGTPIVLECDGWTYHGADRRTFERDRERDAELIAAGWIPVRFTYGGVMRRPAIVADRIRGAYERWAGTTSPDAEKGLGGR